MVMNKKILLLLAPVTLLFNGCGTSLEIRAVEQYAQFQTQSRELFPKIAEDVYRSCIRSIDYVILDRRTINEGRDNDEAMCENPETGDVALRQAYTNIHGVIHSYLVALGNLAADDLTNFDTEINAVRESIQRLPDLDEGQRNDAVGAGTALARLL